MALSALACQCSFSTTIHPAAHTQRPNEPWHGSEDISLHGPAADFPSDKTIFSPALCGQPHCAAPRAILRGERFQAIQTSGRHTVLALASVTVWDIAGKACCSVRSQEERARKVHLTGHCNLTGGPAVSILGSFVSIVDRWTKRKVFHSASMLAGAVRLHDSDIGPGFLRQVELPHPPSNVD